MEGTLQAAAVMDSCRKAFGIFALASFSSHNWLLGDWAERLRKHVIMPLSIKAGGEFTLSQFPLMILDVTLTLAGTISGIEQPDGVGSEPELSEIQHYAYLCYHYTDWGWNAFRPFEWLSIYLYFHRQMPLIPPSDLLNAIEEVEEYGMVFSLSQIVTPDG